MSDDLVERLRGRARFCYDRGEIKSPGSMMEAADAIEALQARVRELEAMKIDRQTMHRRAQVAEGKLAKVKYWVDVIYYYSGRHKTPPPAFVGNIRALIATTPKACEGESKDAEI